MAIFRNAGRRPPGGGLGYPPGCTGQSENLKLPCNAELHGKRCFRCTRSGAEALAGQSDIEPLALLPGPSVQALYGAFRPGPWRVVVFTHGHWIHSRFPVIATGRAQWAREAALARAEQLWPGVALEQVDDRTWRRSGPGGIAIIIGGPL